MDRASSSSLRHLHLHARLLCSLGAMRSMSTFDGALPRRLRRNVRNQRAETLAKCRSSFEHVVPSENQAA
jgi:hypothetical protein